MAHTVSLRSLNKNHHHHNHHHCQDLPAKTYYTRPRRRRWKQHATASWLSVRVMRVAAVAVSAPRALVATGHGSLGQEYRTPPSNCSINLLPSPEMEPLIKEGLKGYWDTKTTRPDPTLSWMDASCEV
jgi:hypothetical protein